MVIWLAFFLGIAIIGVPGLIWLSWSGRLYTKEGTPSASYNKCMESATQIYPCCDGEGRLSDTNAGGMKRCEHCKGKGKL